MITSGLQSAFDFGDDGLALSVGTAGRALQDELDFRAWLAQKHHAHLQQGCQGYSLRTHEVMVLRSKSEF